MHILAFNPGSSTLKYRLFEISANADSVLADGKLEHVAGVIAPGGSCLCLPDFPQR